MLRNRFTGFQGRVKMAYSAYITLRTDYECKDGSRALIMRIILNRKKTDIPMDFRIRPDQLKSGKVINHPMADDLNLIIGQCLARANKIFVDYRLMNRILTKSIFRTEYDNPDARRDFLKFWEDQMNRKLTNGEIEAATWKKHELALRKVREHIASREDIDILYFYELTEQFLKQFDAWHLRKLKSNTRVNGKPLKNNGHAARHNAMKAIKGYITIAQKAKIRFDNPFEHFRLRHPEPPVDRLEEFELEQFMDLASVEWMESGHRRVLHYFLFACFTGLRFCEVEALTWDNVGSKSMRIPEVKDAKSFRERTVPISKVADLFLPDRRKHGPVFEILTNQKTNFYLKDLARRAHVNRPVSFKWSRATFASIFSSAKGNPKALQRILGHRNFTTTMRFYVDVTEEQKQKEVRVFNKFKTGKPLGTEGLSE